MSVFIRGQVGIEPTNDKWSYSGFGDPSVLGLSAAIGSTYTQLDSNPPGDEWSKTGQADTAWTIQLSLPNSATVLSADTVAALAGTSGAPSDTNRFVTDADARLVAGGGSGGSGVPGILNATDNGVFGDGSTDDAPALSTLANTTMSGAGTIYLTPGKTYRIGTAITLPKGITLWCPRGAVLLVDGVVLTIQSAITAGLWQIFTYANGGTVLFSATNNDASNKRVLACPEIYPEWWGAKADNATDDTAALQAAIDATTGLPLTPSTTRRNAGPAIRLSAGLYRTTDRLAATDVTGLVIRGAGRYNTAINHFPNVVDQQFTASGATANTISVATTPFTVNAYNSGYWWVYTVSGTGANQWNQVLSNTNNTITLAANWATTPDNTTTFAVVINAILDLDGVLGVDVSDLCVQTQNSAYCRQAIKYYRNADNSAGGSTQGRFTNVRVTENYIDAGWRFGSKDLSRETNWQSDLCTLVGCQAIGRGLTTGIAANQVGFKFGDSSFDNVLNYTAIGCDSISHKFNVQVNATNVLWIGGTAQSASAADLFINAGVQGYSTFQGLRSELSAMLLDTSSPYGNTFPWNITLRDCDFSLTGFKGNRLINWNLSAGNLTLDGLRTVPNPIRGTATGGTSNTLVDSGKTFNTSTFTYQTGNTSVGLAGWDLRIVAGTGNGQRRQVLSNTGTTLTTTTNWTVTPDATSQYILMPRSPIYMNQGGHARLDRCLFSGTPLEQAVQRGEGGGNWTAEISGYCELDDQAAMTFGSATVQGGSVRVSAGKNAPSVLGFQDASSTTGVDALLTRSEAGALGAPNLSVGTLHVAAVGAPAGSATKLGIANTGTTQYNYKIVCVDGKGNKSLPSATFSTAANCGAVLDAQGNAYIGIGPAAGVLPPLCASVDVLKDDGTGTFKFLGNCPAWRFGQFYDVGQPLTTYSIPGSDATGNAAVDGTLTVAGTINSTTVSTATIPTAVQLSGLTGGGDTSLHFHSADRARSNHTGTQSLSTIAGGTATGSGYTLPDLTVSGLTTASGGLIAQLALRTVTSNTTATVSDQVIEADATAGNIVVTLPAVATMGKAELFVKKIDSSANTVRVAASGTDTIDGAASVTLSTQFATWDGVSNGSATWDTTTVTGGGSVPASSVTSGTFGPGGYTFPSTLTVTSTLTASSTANFNGNTFAGQWIGQKYFNAGNSSTALTIAPINGAWQKITLTGNCTFTITSPPQAGPLTLWLIQDATGSRTVTWPATVKWAGGTAPTLTTTATKTDIITLRWDLTNFWGQVVGQNY